MVFLAYEGIRGKPPSENIQIGLSYVGLFLLLGLMVWGLRARPRIHLPLTPRQGFHAGPANSLPLSTAATGPRLGGSDD